MPKGSSLGSSLRSSLGLDSSVSIDMNEPGTLNKRAGLQLGLCSVSTSLPGTLRHCAGQLISMAPTCFS